MQPGTVVARTVRGTCLVLALGVVLAACGEPSAVDPDAAVEVLGSVVDARDDAVSDADVLFIKETPPEEFLLEGAGLFGNIGVACLFSDGLDLLEHCAEEGHHTLSGPDGTFRLSVPGEAVRSLFGTVSRMVLAAAGEPADGEETGPVTAYTVRVREEVVQVPPLRLWAADVRVTDRSGTLEVTWADPPSALEARGDPLIQVEDPTGQLIWVTDDAFFDHRALEDHRAAVTVTLDAVLSAGDARWDAVLRSGRVAVTGPGAPSSRGATCAIVVPDDDATVPLRPCPFTDGNLGEATRVAAEALCPDERPCPPDDVAVVIDLGAVSQISLVVIRGDDDPVELAVSSDGAKWEPLGRVDVDAGHAAVPVGDVPGRYVRIRGATRPLGDVVELSVW